MKTIPDSFFQKLVTQLDDDNTVGIALTGSFARGEGDFYSMENILHPEDSAIIHHTLEAIKEAGY
jgi:hypothetical protein